MPIEIIPDVPVINYDDIVEVNGDLYQGVGRVFQTAYPTEQPKREMAYGLRRDLPFPQVAVVPLTGEEPPILFDAKDLLAGKLKVISIASDFFSKLPEEEKEVIPCKMLMNIGTFDGGYSRVGTINLVFTKCDICNGLANCICIDGSEGEYDGGIICKDCIDKAFENKEG